MALDKGRSSGQRNDRDIDDVFTESHRDEEKVVLRSAGQSVEIRRIKEIFPIREERISEMKKIADEGFFLENMKKWEKEAYRQAHPHGIEIGKILKSKNDMSDYILGEKHSIQLGNMNNNLGACNLHSHPNDSTFSPRDIELLSRDGRGPVSIIYRVPKRKKEKGIYEAVIMPKNGKVYNLPAESEIDDSVGARLAQKHPDYSYGVKEWKETYNEVMHSLIQRAGYKLVTAKNSKELERKIQKVFKEEKYHE